MMTLFRRVSFFTGFVSLGLACLHADPATLAKARAYIGPEAALDAVQSLRFKGELSVSDGSAESGSPSAQLEILFQKPDRQRITATSDARTETTALDGYDAWQRVVDPADPSRWQVTLLGPDQIKRLRANTFENLAFYRNIEQSGGRIEDKGSATVDGVACRKLAFVHGPGIVFTRSFEIATGRLVLTETDSGTAIREIGELRAGGLRFPQKIITTNMLDDGSKRVITVVFNSVEVNPTLEATVFALPVLTD